MDKRIRDQAELKLIAMPFGPQARLFRRTNLIQSVLGALVFIKRQRQQFLLPLQIVSSLAVLLVWIYYSAQILFFGAELTQACADRRGSKQPG
jgi:hypothetical protein